MIKLMESGGSDEDMILWKARLPDARRFKNSSKLEIKDRCQCKNGNQVERCRKSFSKRNDTTETSQRHERIVLKPFCVGDRKCIVVILMI